MKSQLEVDRKLFLEVIDDLAKDAVRDEREKEATPEQRAQWEQEARERGYDIPAAPEDIEETEEVTEEEAADRFRQAIARTDLKELLFHRRYTGKSICKQVARVGRSHAIPWAPILQGSIERLQAMDAEIRRRIPGRGPVPPDRSAPEDTTESS